MKAGGRPASGRGKNLFVLRRSPSSASFLVFLLILACVLSRARIQGSRESSSLIVSAADSSPPEGTAGSSSAPRPFSCPAQTRQRLTEACAGKLQGKKGAPPAPCSLADVASAAAIQTEGARAQEDGQQHPERVAICLIGGARHFQLTGASLQRNLLQAYDDSDVFFISSPDKDSYKLSILSVLSKGSGSQQQAQGSSRFAVFNMSQQQHIDVTMYPTHHLSVPHLQGQLQQFLKLETCADTISAFESAIGRQYSWVLWTRLDSYWHTPPPPLASLDPQAYHVPSAFSWGGLNDRFGMGTRDVALRAMRRLSWFRNSNSFFETLLQNSTASSDQSSPFAARLLETSLSGNSKVLAGMPVTGLNSEKLLKLQLLAQGIKAQGTPLGFCIVTFARRRYAIASLRSGQAVNGTSCRPCAQNSVGICPQRSVRSGWREAFEQGASEDERSAAAHLEQRGAAACRAEWDAFLGMFCVASVPQHFRAC